MRSREGNLASAPGHGLVRYSSLPVFETNEPLVAPPADLATVAALRQGDERTFAGLVDRYGAQMLRLAMIYTPSRAVAEEVVQEAWIGVLDGLPRFEGRSALKTWIFRILVNRAITRGTRERRSAPFSSVWEAGDPAEPTVDPARFLDEKARWPGHWALPPDPWDEIPEARLLAGERLAFVQAALAKLPTAQR